MVDESSSHPPDAPPAPSRRRWPRRGRKPLAAVAGGVLMALSVPPWGWWPLAFAGIALFDVALDGAPAWSRFRRGWLLGAGLLIPSTIWMVAITPPGYVVQVVGFSSFLGTFVALCPPSRWRWLALPGAWALFEGTKGRWPFGGVPLSELAMGQVSGPLAGLARVGGIMLIGLATVAVGLALAAAVRQAWRPAAALVVVVAVLVGGSALAPRGEDTGRRITVAYVQGGGEQGTVDEETDDREVFLAHLRASDAVPVGTDLTVWPENVVNVDGPVEREREGRELADLARRKRTTLVAGVVEGAGPEHFRNSAIVYGPDGSVVTRYEKVRRVPFGEFVPLRGVLERLAGGAVPSKDAIAGRTTNTLDTPAGRIGVVISWEVFFGDRGRDAMGGRGRPGELLLNPTNGSSYRGTIVQSQQVAASRIRAIESGRWEVQIAPTGFSAFVTPDGEVLGRSAVSERRVEVRTVALRRGRTLYGRLGEWPTLLIAGALMVIAQVLHRRTVRRSASAQEGGRRERRAAQAATEGGTVGEQLRPVQSRSPSSS